jgi:hypothetical protein
VQLLLYASKDDENGKRLMAAVHEALPQRPIGIFRQLSALQGGLRTLIAPDSIAVLSAVDQAELQRLQTLRGLLTEIFVVLVVPDCKKSTIRLAHLLLPRFISQKDDSFSDLKKVLKKMVSTPH